MLPYIIELPQSLLWPSSITCWLESHVGTLKVCLVHSSRLPLPPMDPVPLTFSQTARKLRTRVPVPLTFNQSARKLRTRSSTSLGISWVCLFLTYRPILVSKDHQFGAHRPSTTSLVSRTFLLQLNSREPLILVDINAEDFLVS